MQNAFTSYLVCKHSTFAPSIKWIILESVSGARLLLLLSWDCFFCIRSGPDTDLNFMTSYDS